LAPGRARGDEWRGHDLLARFSLAAGRPSEVAPHLAALEQLDPAWTLGTRATFALAPFMPQSPDELLAIRAQVTRWQRLAPGALLANPDLRVLHPQLRAYLLGILAIPAGDWAGARQAAAELDTLAGTPGDSGVARDLAHLLRADVDRASGASAAGLREIEQFRFAPETMTWRLLFDLHPRARFVRAELLHALGRDNEALEWYASFPDPAVIDLEFLAPARLRQAEIEEHLGRRDAARAHYAKFLTLWRDPDPGLVPVITRARQALARLGGAPVQVPPQPPAAAAAGH
jgi:tetratricopeptide (TPR) repeat protein